MHKQCRNSNWNIADNKKVTKKYETYKSDRWVGKSNVYLCFLFADEKVLSKGAHRPFGHDAL